MKTPLPLPQFFHDIDVHTHADPPGHPAIVCVSADGTLGNNPWYSVGIHPWEAADATEETFQRLRAMAGDPRVVAIGEAGLDRRKGPAIDTQLPVFERQARLAEELRLPLVIHCVGATDMLLALHKRMRPAVPWIIHGFRGKPTTARQLTDAGFYLSLGQKYNPLVMQAVPQCRILRETDETIS